MSQVSASNADTAEDIVENNKSLDGLSKEQKRTLKKVLGGNYETDPTLAREASDIIEHVEERDADGRRFSHSIDVNDGKIGGYEKTSTTDFSARSDTEADRLETFFDEGYSALKGGKFDGEDIYITSSEKKAQRIIEGNDTLAHLAPKQIRDLKKALGGDYTRDPELAQEASDVIDHIEKYDEDGSKITDTGDIGDGRIGGYNKKGKPGDNTEARRLQDFFNDGYEALKGGDIDGIDPNLTPEVREAQKIVSDNPSLDGLREEDERAMKAIVGDYDVDADAAREAADIIEQIEREAKKEGPQRRRNGGGAEEDLDSVVGDGKIDGFYSASGTRKASRGSEAAELIEFFEEGYSSLGGKFDGKKNPEPDPSDKVNQEWFDAIEEGDVKTIAKFIEEKPYGWSIDVADSKGRTGLLKAANDGDGGTDVVELLLEGGADVTIANKNRWTSLNVIDETLEILDGKSGKGVEVGKELLSERRELIQDKLDGNLADAYAEGDTNTAEGLIDAGAEEIETPEEIAEAFDFDGPGSFDVVSMETTRPRDEEDSDAGNLTVSEAALTDLLTDFKERIEDGDLSEDSKEAKLVRAFEASAAATDGTQIVPYDGGNLFQYDDAVELPETDTAELINLKEVNATIDELMVDPDIAKEYDGFVKNALSDIKGGASATEIFGDVESALTGDGKGDFLDYISALEKAGYTELAQSEVQSAVGTYALLGKDEGVTEEDIALIEEDLVNSVAANELDNILENPDDYDEDEIELPDGVIAEDLDELAVYDAVNIVPKSLIAGAGAAGAVKIKDFLNELNDLIKDNPAELKNLTKVFKDLGKSSAPITSDSVENAVKNAGGSNKLSQTLRGLASNGVLGGIIGISSLGAGAYKLGAGYAETPLERLSAAKDFILAAAASGAFVKTTNKLSNMLTGNNTVWLGLDRSMSELLGKPSATEIRPNGVPTDLYRDLSFGMEDALNSERLAPPTKTVKTNAPDLGGKQMITTITSDGTSKTTNLQNPDEKVISYDVNDSNTIRNYDTVDDRGVIRTYKLDAGTELTGITSLEKNGIKEVDTKILDGGRATASGPLSDAANGVGETTDKIQVKTADGKTFVYNAAEGGKITGFGYGSDGQIRTITVEDKNGFVTDKSLSRQFGPDARVTGIGVETPTGTSVESRWQDVTNNGSIRDTTTIEGLTDQGKNFVEVIDETGAKRRIEIKDGYKIVQVGMDGEGNVKRFKVENGVGKTQIFDIAPESQVVGYGAETKDGGQVFKSTGDSLKPSSYVDITTLTDGLGESVTNKVTGLNVTKPDGTKTGLKIADGAVVKSLGVNNAGDIVQLNVIDANGNASVVPFGAGTQVDTISYEGPDGTTSLIDVEGGKIATPATSQPLDAPKKPTGAGKKPSNPVIDTVKGPDADKPSRVLSRGQRTGGFVMKALVPLGGVAGVLDVALGAINIKDGLANDNTWQVVQGANGVVSGASATAAGGLAVAAFFGPASSGLVAAAGAFGLVGAILAGGTVLFSFLAEKKNLEKEFEQVEEMFEQWADDGLLKPGWRDKLDFAIESFDKYNGRDAPGDMSYFEFQQDELKFFSEGGRDYDGNYTDTSDDAHIDIDKENWD